MPNFTYFNTLFLCVWLQVINKVKFIHQGEGHIKVKVKYLHPFKFYVARTFCKRVVCIRLSTFLFHKRLSFCLRGMCVPRGHVCMPGGVRGWGGGACVQERWLLQRAVRILLECILLPKSIYVAPIYFLIP